jgi:outer membrane protein TolC
LALAVATAVAPPAVRAATNGAHALDLATALRLAGAQNLDVQIARERLNEAKANHESARAQFFPWVSPGVGYRRHDNRIQDVAGTLLDVNKQSYSIGASFTAEVQLGEAAYRSLAAKQTVKTAEHAAEAQQQQSVLAAALGYFDLARAQGQSGVAREAVRISTEYANQLQRAVETGLAYKGELLRVQVQLERNRLAARRAGEQQRLAATRLAQILRLDPAVDLQAAENELVPLALTVTNRALDSLVAQALARRPELKQAESFARTARKEKAGATYGPMVPTLGAQVYAGGLGGGQDGDLGNFGDTQSYQLQLSWRIGPGGLFDHSRLRATEARLQAASLGTAKTQDEIIRQVVDAHTRLDSLADQLATARRALAAAEEALKIARERREFGVAVVLENILAEQELTTVRNEYLFTVAEQNKAQYLMRGAIGELK